MISLKVKKIAGAALLCLMLIFPAGCSKKKTTFAFPPPQVTVTKPECRDIVDYQEISGNTQAENTVQLLARVEGYLEGVYFRDGDIVKKGQLLFLIQQDTYQAQLQQAEGNVQNQQALLRHAKTEFARYSKLYAQKAAADTDVENWRYQRETAQAGLLSAKAQRDLAKLNLGYARVVAPFTGRIDRRLVDPGNLVGSAGSNTSLAALTQIDPLYVYFNIAETVIPPYLKDLRTCAALNRSGPKRDICKFPVYMGLATETGYPHEGYLDFAASTVNQSTGTLLLRGVFQNRNGAILPGEFVRVRFPLGKKHPAILVSQAAVQYDQSGAYLLIVNPKDNTVERRDVTVGPVKGYSYVIEKGLTGNELIVTKGVLKAIPGGKVNPVLAKGSPKDTCKGTTK
ncbi:MAG: efflux RND transporter periplasmic adaptor subunit [Syntrophobacteraceae bacterium]|nr:efflux RND transporter periplasmic adaptor subunit [Syntrophobacteraceae bacterium]